ncbi:nitrate- and nitrite sensing domain-containing protein [Puerhibacterium sp. TATVAM-FAB25]|uniref:sensor histidine kinase n=1 Tax=Puerhibacterium sp. TATVAM-FAB25 TaxID=3093699 RepID=UPI00397E5543
MLRWLGVRGKILATLAVPVLVLAVAAAWISYDSLMTAQRAGQTSEVVDLLAVQDRAGSAVAAERALSVAMSLGIPGAGEQYEAAHAETDAALEERDQALLSASTDALPQAVQDAITTTLRDRDAVTRLREEIVSGAADEAEATERYTEIIDRALDVPRELAQATDDRGLSQRIEAYVAMDEAMLAVVEERPVVGAVLSMAATGRSSSALSLRMASLLHTTDTSLAEAQQQLEAAPGGGTLPEITGAFGDVRSALLSGEVAALDPAEAASWSQLSQDWVTAAQSARDDVRADTSTAAGDLAGDATRTAVVTALAVFGLLLLSIAIALVIARQIVRPLRHLTSAAGQVRDRLPQMVEQMRVPGQVPSLDLVEIPVESRDEIGRLATAFNDVNATTAQVAREQAALRGAIAEMFVNVARRDQVLLNRQLAFLDELERSEEDPTTLSNLFRLDHLATRMRRNAESLLVLAGIDSGRRVRQPMPVSDVIRTASSEIELYDRVRLDLRLDPLMLGHNALGAAHLLAELLENATMFSEPHTPVEVSTSRDERGVVVTVRDHGLGMTPEEIDAANRKVASRSASDAVGAQRLGLFVVGRLAERLGAQVGFATGPDGSGTVVTVVFPAALFLPDEAAPLPAPTDPLEASTQAAAALLGQGGGPTAVVTGPQPATVPLGGVAAPAAAPAPAYQPVVAPEPPAAVPVDLAALTDGTTAAGMPRRRASGAQPPADSGAVVLPPLPAPALPADVADGGEVWTPPVDVQTSGTALPSRRRGSSPESAPQPVAPTTSPVDVQARTGLFSSFRSFTSLEPDVASTGTLHLEAPVEDPAALPEPLTQPIEPVVDGGADRPAVERPAEQPAAREPAAAQLAAEPAPEAQPAAEPAPEAQPAAEPAPEAQPAPQPVARPVGTPLPPFDELMADLPTRRTLREAGRRRGRSARRPEEATTGPTQAAEPTTPAGGTAAAPAATVAPQPVSSFAPAAAPEPAAPAVEPVASEPAGAPEPAVVAEPAPSTPALDEWRGSTSHAPGGTALPLRTPSGARVAGEQAEPDAAGETPDTVEARSEWIASAVLYEEMSTLLRRGILPQASPAAEDAATYQPRAVAVTDGSGLARRDRTTQAEDQNERFTARIQRDPEQLRSRLSAFQSATRQARPGGEGEPAGTPVAPDHSRRPAPTETAPGAH